MAPKKAYSAAQCVRLSVGALHEQCIAWGVPCKPGQLDIEIRASLARRIHEEQADKPQLLICRLCVTPPLGLTSLLERSGHNFSDEAAAKSAIRPVSAGFGLVMR